MFCHKCHGDLAAFDSMLDKMEKCPLCGESLKKEQVLPEQKSFAELCQMLKDKSSEEIFGSSDLIQKLTELDLSFQNARDRMSILCIRDIPGRMFRVAAAPKGEQEFELGACQKILMDDLGISVENSTSMLNGLQKVLFKKPVDIPAAYNDSTFTDPRDGHVYKTVRIGNQVWMAENLCYATPTNYVVKSYANLAQDGFFYSFDNLKNIAPKGWHVPSSADYQELLHAVSSTNFDPVKSLVLKEYGGDNHFSFNVRLIGGFIAGGSEGRSKNSLDCDWINDKTKAYFGCSNENFAMTVSKNGIELIKLENNKYWSNVQKSYVSIRLVKDKV